MRWVRNIFAVLAIVCGLTCIASVYYSIGAGAPLWKPDLQLEASIYRGRVTIASWHCTIPNLTRGYYINSQYVDTEALRFNAEFMHDIGLPTPDELPFFEYKPYESYTDPAGRWS